MTAHRYSALDVVYIRDTLAMLYRDLLKRIEECFCVEKDAPCAACMELARVIGTHRRRVESALTRLEKK